MIFVIDFEFTGLLDRIKGPNDMHVMAYACQLEDGTWTTGHTTEPEDVARLIGNPEHTLVGHNLWGFDIPAIKLAFGWDVKARVHDTWLASMYLDPYREKHGLAAHGEDFGVPKPEVEDWENQPIEVYIERCIEDVKINANLYIKQERMLMDLYGDQEDIARIKAFLNMKGEVYYNQWQNPFTLDVDLAHEYVQELTDLLEENEAPLRKVMPKVPKYGTRTRPKQIKKKDGTLTAHAEKWFSLLKFEGLPEDHTEPVKYINGHSEPNPGSVHQVKKWLTELGWKPVRTKDGVPQLKDDDKNLCQSVKLLIPQVPEIAHLENITYIKARRSTIEGMLEMHQDGKVTATMSGLTNTLRIRHRKPCVNLIKPSEKFGKYIRTLLLPSDGHVLIGSDLSGLESVTRNNFVLEHDPKFVETQEEEFYDPHLEIAVLAGHINESDALFYKLYKDAKKNNNGAWDDGSYYGDRVLMALDSWQQAEGMDYDEPDEWFEELDQVRQRAKTANYCVPVEGSEVLTPEGWKAYSELSVGSNIFAFDRFKNELVITPITELPTWEDAQVGTLSNAYNTFVCTPNHRWVVNKRYSKETNMVVETQDLDTESNILQAAPYVNGSPPEGIMYARALGWLLSDGHINWSTLPDGPARSNGKKKGVAATIAQKKFRSQLEADLILSGVPHHLQSVRKDGVAIYYLDPQWIRDMFDYFDQPYQDPKILNWTKAVVGMGTVARDAFLEAFWLADGGLIGSRAVYYQKPGPIAEAIKVALILQGKAMSIQRSKANLCEVIAVKNRQHITGQRLKWADKGTVKVFCPNNGHGTFVLRQGKCISITCNSALYGVGAPKLSKTVGCTEKEARQLLDAYWEKNWAVKYFASTCEIKDMGEELGLWIKNPINGFWYSLRALKDAFSTVNQSAGDYIHTLWVAFMLREGVRLHGNFHDEVVTSCPPNEVESTIEKLYLAIDKVNEHLQLPITVEIDHKTGDNYAKVH